MARTDRVCCVAAVGLCLARARLWRCVSICRAATSIKRSMDAATSSTWHCIVGADFGCSLAFENKHLLFLQADGKHVLLFKSFDQA